MESEGFPFWISLVFLLKHSFPGPFYFTSGAVWDCEEVKVIPRFISRWEFRIFQYRSAGSLNDAHASPDGYDKTAKPDFQ